MNTLEFERTKVMRIFAITSKFSEKKYIQRIPKDELTENSLWCQGIDKGERGHSEIIPLGPEPHSQFGVFRVKYSVMPSESFYEDSSIPQACRSVRIGHRCKFVLAKLDVV